MADLESLIQSHITRSAAARQRVSSMNHIARMAAISGDWSAFEAAIDERIRILTEQASDGQKTGTGSGGGAEPASDSAV